MVDHNHTQVKLYKPVDIEGSIALRSEEDGFWQRSVSAMLHCLLKAAGCSGGQVLQPVLLCGWARASMMLLSLPPVGSQPCELSQRGMVHDFLTCCCGRTMLCQASCSCLLHTSCALHAYCLYCYPRAGTTVDEYFYQDTWEGAKSLSDQILLYLGDPLEQVGIDFTPSTLVQNWRMA